MTGALSPFGVAALAHATKGRRVFPLVPRTKRPITEHGFLDASADPAVVRAWWERWPDANIGLPTGGWGWVLDPDGAEGAETLAMLEREHGEIPTTTRVRTPGGRHIYLLEPDLPEGSRLVNRAAVAVGIDVRCLGGYVVVPPSRVTSPPEKTTGFYAWECRAPLAAPPAWLVELVVQRQPEEPAHAPVVIPSGDMTRLTRYGRAALDSEVDRVRSAPKGQRQYTLARAAFRLGRLVGAGALGEEDARAWMTFAGLRAGLAQGEVERTVKSGLSRGREHPREVRRTA